MNAAPTTTGYGGLIKNVIITLVAVVALYWLYQYLYAPSDGQGIVLLSGKQKADIVLKSSGGRPLNPIATASIPG